MEYICTSRFIVSRLTDLSLLFGMKFCCLQFVVVQWRTGYSCEILLREKDKREREPYYLSMKKASPKPPKASREKATKHASANNNNMKVAPPGLALLASGKSAVTPFQHQVLQTLCHVPAGKVTTYKHLAQKINCRSNQAVGQALRRNPYAPVVPCHRVVAHDGTLGGFGGARIGVKLDKKRQLLQQEGVEFDKNGNVAESSIYDFQDESK